MRDIQVRSALHTGSSTPQRSAQKACCSAIHAVPGVETAGHLAVLGHLKCLPKAGGQMMDERDPPTSSLGVRSCRVGWSPSRGWVSSSSASRRRGLCPARLITRDMNDSRSCRMRPDALDLHRLLIFHMGTWGCSPGEATQKCFTLAEKQQTHWGRPFQSAYCGWSVPTNFFLAVVFESPRKKRGALKKLSLSLSAGIRCTRPVPLVHF